MYLCNAPEEKKKLGEAVLKSGRSIDEISDLWSYLRVGFFIEETRNSEDRRKTLIHRLFQIATYVNKIFASKQELEGVKL